MNKNKMKCNRHINIRLPDQLLNECLKISYEENISLSRVVRTLIWISKMEYFKHLRQYVFLDDFDPDYYDKIEK